MFWAEVFVLPKKVVKVIEATCRSFLWSGGTESSKKALLAWERVCYRKAAGGLNILDISVWNKATIGKLLWNLCMKKDKLWVKWIHCYYGRNRNLLLEIPKQASWVVQKILQATKHFIRGGYGIEGMLILQVFSTKQFYQKLRGQYQKVSWRRLICNNYGLPRWIFILQMAAHSRLPTKDRLFKWGILKDKTFPLCNQVEETTSHLFFTYNFSAQVWTKLLAWMNIRSPMAWEEELGWAAKNAKGKAPIEEV